MKILRTFFIGLLLAMSLTGQAQIQASGLTTTGLQVVKANEAELQAWLDRGTALGYTLPSAAQIVYLNNFCKCLKENDIYSYLDIMYIFAIDGDSDMATINFITPASYQITKVNSPTFSSGGFTGNGTTSYLNDPWVSGTNGVHYTQNDASAIVWINSNVSNDSQVDFGYENNLGNTQNLSLISKRAASNVARYRINHGTITDPSIPSATSVGLYHLQRTASTTTALFKNGSTLGTGSETSAALQTAWNLFLLARNDSGAGAGFSTRQMSFFAAGASLSGKELKFYNCWNTYKTAIGL